MARWCSKCQKFTTINNLCDSCGIRINDIQLRKEFKPPLTKLNQLYFNIQQIENDVKKICGDDIFSISKPDKFNQLNTVLNQIKSDYLTNNFEKGVANLGSLILLLRNMHDILQYDEELFNKTIKELKSHLGDLAYFGFRFEVLIISSFIRKDIKFTKREAPDFNILYNNEDFYAECTSVRFQKSATVNEIELKINRKIQAKNRKPYANQDTILFLDITNMSRLAAKTNIYLNLLELQQQIKEEMSKIKYGCILLYTSLYDRDKVRYTSGYLRIDNENISINLKDFLDLHFPMGNTRIESALHGREM